VLKPKSLQQRFALILLLPVALILLGVSILGFGYASKNLFALWREVTILKLQRGAHQVDMRLARIKEWLQIFHNTAGEEASAAVQDWIVDQLRSQEGVARVSLDLGDVELNQEGGPRQGQEERPLGPARGVKHGGRRRMQFKRARISEITSPHYDSIKEHHTVSLISDLIDENGHTVGRLEVAVRFDYLVQDIMGANTFKDRTGYLVDRNGNVLICNDPKNPQHLGDDGNPLAKETLAAMATKPFGTLFGKGHPPDQVSSFYRLREAPWTLVVFAPGKEILAPIIRFRIHYVVTGFCILLLILLLIRLVIGRTVSSIKQVSSAAGKIAQGRYGPPLPVKTEDEVGQLIRSFNSMVLQLEEGVKLKEALDLAMEIQQSFLPQRSPDVRGLDIAGKAIYCDETGGDYYDFLHLFELGDGRIAVAVGDVVGHGIGAALLMTTVRAFLRGRVAHAGSAAEMITDVNRLMCIDTQHTGDFMTLFFLLLDADKREMHWVRAGHDPAIVYDPVNGSFEELKGSGMALGVDDAAKYQDYSSTKWNDGQIVVIGTDGIWECVNLQGEMYGKDRLREIVRSNKELSAEQIMQAIIADLADFRQMAPQNDDITLVVVKTKTS
jgi:sigma-B regulation protein RsbU (phosphoserine phosphatase)